MKRREIPEYYCMPSEPGMPDARVKLWVMGAGFLAQITIPLFFVNLSLLFSLCFLLPSPQVGQWSNEKLGGWYAKQKQTLVSNEWEPFPIERLKMKQLGVVAAAVVPAAGEETEGRASADTTESLLSEGAALAAGIDPLLVVFVTTVREPLNRLLSAYRFWGVLHNPSEKKPPAARWLKNMQARALADSKSLRGMGRGVGTGRDFIARVGQPNFATWKFSGGSLPVFGWPFSDQPEASWVPSFEQVACFC
jgi:hypothetical protein